jgi:hypothetical protein
MGRLHHCAHALSCTWLICTPVGHDCRLHCRAPGQTVLHGYRLHYCARGQIVPWDVLINAGTVALPLVAAKGCAPYLDRPLVYFHT